MNCGYCTKNLSLSTKNLSLSTKNLSFEYEKSFINSLQSLIWRGLQGPLKKVLKILKLMKNRRTLLFCG